MKTYKLLRLKHDKLYPMFVLSDKELEIGRWLSAEIGELSDSSHVKSRIGPLALRPGFHSTEVPFTDWIGKKASDGRLFQRPDTVWCECEIRGNQLEADRKGLKEIPDGWYFFKTKANQPHPWIISKEIMINRILDQDEVKEICSNYGIKAQEIYKS